VANSAACTGSFTHYVPTQNMCNAAGNVVTPCCRADFNKVNGVNQADVFDFLNAWLAGSLMADFDGNGTQSPTQSSVVDYLNAWFAGGC
jgi:hypothetical protein